MTRFNALTQVAVFCVLASGAILCADARGELYDMYVSHLGGVNKYLYDTSDNTATLDADFSLSSGGNLVQPQGVAIGPDDLLYVVGQDTHNVNRYNPTSGAYIDTVATLGASQYPAGLAFGPDNSGDGVEDLYISQWDSAIGRVPTEGPGAGVVTTFTSGGSLSASSDVAFGPDGNLYAVSASMTIVERFNGTTGAWIDTFATQTDNTVALGFSDDGTALFTTRYVAYPGAGINKFDATDGSVIAEPFGDGVGYTTCAVWGPDHNGNGSGDVYVGHALSSNNGNQIDVFDGSTGDYLGAVIDTGLDRPKFVAFKLVPEPGTLVLLLAAAAGLMGIRRRRA